MTGEWIELEFLAFMDEDGMLKERRGGGYMNVRELVLRKEKQRGIMILPKLEQALGREFHEEEVFEILLNAYGNVKGQAADHMAVHLGLDAILSQEEMDRIYAFEADVEQKNV